MRPWKAWFLPQDQDVLGALRAQAEAVEAAVRVVRDWSAEELSPVAAVEQLRALRLTEDVQRRAVNVKVRAAFSTPIEPEDVFELAERLGEVIEEAYGLVREAQLTAVAPDDALRAMTSPLAAASSVVLDAVRALPQPRAAEIADAARPHLQEVEHGYRQALAGLAGADVHHRVVHLEVYRRAEHLEVALRRVARRTWYAVAKLD